MKDTQEFCSVLYYSRNISINLKLFQKKKEKKMLVYFKYL